MTTPERDGLDLLMGEHRLVEQLFLQLDAAVAAGDETDRRELADRIVAALSVHAAIEEEVLYPAARRVPAAEGLVDESEAEHAELKALLARLEGEDPADADVAERFGRARERFTSHVDEEEGELFPRLREALDDGERATLGDRLAEARKRAPTSPGPAGPVAGVAEAAASLIDKAKDALRHLTN